MFPRAGRTPRVTSSRMVKIAPAGEPDQDCHRLDALGRRLGTTAFSKGTDGTAVNEFVGMFSLLSAWHTRCRNAVCSGWKAVDRRV